MFFCGAVAPAVLLLVVLGFTLRTLRAQAAPAGGAPALTVEVTGRQFWWELRYPASGAVTANELHVPVGQDVELRVEGEDVIHSFWVPRLAGKIDAIPGRVNVLRLVADAPGAFQGRCAEFCGLGHSGMQVLVQAHDAPLDRARLKAAIMAERER